VGYVRVTEFRGSANVSAYEVDVIVTVGSAVLAAKQATSDIPIVFALAADPVGSGLVASLAQPGGNVNGLWLQQTDAGGLYATYPKTGRTRSYSWRSLPRRSPWP
jgi:ABC transporter substrate binding protein